MKKEVVVLFMYHNCQHVPREHHSCHSQSISREGHQGRTCSRRTPASSPSHPSARPNCPLILLIPRNRESHFFSHLHKLYKCRSGRQSGKLVREDKQTNPSPFFQHSVPDIRASQPRGIINCLSSAKWLLKFGRLFL